MTTDNNKKTTDEQNAVENLNSHLTRAGERVANNKKIIYWSIGVVLAVACFIMSYLFIYRNPRLEKSGEAFSKVEMTAMGNDSIAAAEYRKVADQYGNTDAGNLAALSAAESYYNLGRYQDAINYLDRFDTDEKVLAASAEVLKGDCYVNLKKYDNALDAFQGAIRKADGNPQIVPRVLLKEANIYDLQKKYDKALTCYETIQKDYPEFAPGNGVDMDAYIEREKARLGK
jgi:tetratricopeptide repeat protein